jgi:hypothetical protein
MALPTKVQQQLDMAESTLQLINAAAEAPAPAPVEIQPAEAPAPVSATVEVAPAKPAVDEFRQKYLSLQGVHRSFEDKIRNLERNNAQIAADLERAQRAPEKALQETNPQDAENFGQDMVEMVQRVAETMFGSAAKAIDARLQAIEQRLEGTAQVIAKTAEETFYERLAAAVPNYAAINTSDDFLLWLGEEDGISGMPRQNALTAAGEVLDAARVAKVFLAFMGSQAPAEPASPAKPSAAAQLAKQVTPSSASAPSVRPPAKNTYTVAEVQSFYRDMQSGKYRGQEAVAAQLEASINQALADNRIVDQQSRYTPN